MRAEAAPTPPSPAGQAAADEGRTPAPPPLPADLVGTWTATPDAKVSITLVLVEDGGYSWAVTQASRTQTIQGRAGFQGDVLVLGQEQGPPLTGKVRLDPAGSAFSSSPPAPPPMSPA